MAKSNIWLENNQIVFKNIRRVENLIIFGWVFLYLLDTICNFNFEVVQNYFEVETQK